VESRHKTNIGFIREPFYGRAVCGVVLQAPPSLTPIERTIVALIAEGRSAKEIARTTALAPRTIERHMDVCRQKLGAVNNAHLVAAALASGQITV
jgi:DNA-binding CsgD family transcriptional regulator